MRRRACRYCGHRFATFEVTEADPASGAFFKKI
jgi:transcriptional regulator NrdR family protein